MEHKHKIGFDRLILKTHKCFNGINGLTLSKIKPLNVIVGKNNAGKSMIIDIIKALIKVDFGKFEHVPEYEFRITQELLNYIPFHLGYNNAQEYFISSVTNQLAVKEMIDKTLFYEFPPFRIRQVGDSPIRTYNSNDTIYREIGNLLEPFHHDRLLIQLSAERDLVAEVEKSEVSIDLHGAGASNAIRIIINLNEKTRDFIEIRLLEELNKILFPDIQFSRLLIQQDGSGACELFCVSGFS